MTDTPPTPTGSEAQPNFANPGLDSLQSAEQMKLLDIMDKLRSFGVSEFVSLPQIIVCGDQSAGKSSVLEAITELPFPRKENLCTRFATQIVLRRSPTTNVSVKIIPDTVRQRTEEVLERLSSFRHTLKDFSELPAIVEQAGEAMGIGSGSGNTFSRDVLSIEISGASQPHLTVVDLPGLIHTSSDKSSDVELVSSLVGTYMKNERTIILAVVTAMNDFQNQIVLQRAKEVDPNGERTLGVITKPDSIPVGSEKEDAFVKLAKNEEIFFGLGWHALRNRSYEERNDTFEQRNQKEEIFFETGAWAQLPRETVGITTLRTRLSKLLYDHIKAELPKVCRDIQAALDYCRKELEKLGPKRGSVDEQRMFLTHLSIKFLHLCKEAVDGIYEDKFFGDSVPVNEEDIPKRLRALVQNMGLDFAKTFRACGHTIELLEEPTTGFNFSPDSIKKIGLNLPERLTRKKAIEWVMPLIKHSRGKELPGSFNPLLIGNLFWEQSRPWEALAPNHLDSVYNACEVFLGLALPYLTTKEIASPIMHRINIAMKERLENAKKELGKMLTDRRKQAITFNHYYTVDIQKSRQKQLLDNLKATLSSPNATMVARNGIREEGYTMSEIKECLTKIITSDMDEYACEEVLRSMLAYYQVASKTFVDNIAVQVIERHLLHELWNVFSPISVMSMLDNVVSAIAGESSEHQNRRHRLDVKKEVLMEGLKVCREALPGMVVEDIEGGGE
ncbi:P-loop containing nucleoside triphosphate hydrolase protein [Trichophaea hybrida]|nr:P-loop containing nucleoside triphosphate hydrolase protein [Trichophaea hybrida]